MNPRTALVTGIAGFIGSNLGVRLLSEGMRVIGIDNLAHGVREQVPAGVEFHEMDIRSRLIYPLFEGVDVVYHLAAKNCISDCQADPVETADINVTGSVNVLEASRRARVGKVVYAESSALYEGSSLFPTPESEVRPESFYAVSKAGEMAFAQAYARFFGLRLTALRYFCVYGPRQDYRRTIPPLMSSIIIRLLGNASPVIFGSGTKRRDFVHVDDVNDFHLLAARDPRTDGYTYNLGSGMNHSVLEIYRMIESILRVEVAPTFEPDLPGEAEVTLADVSAARGLGWEPRVDLQRGLAQMIEWLKVEVVEKGVQVKIS